MAVESTAAPRDKDLASIAEARALARAARQAQSQLRAGDRSQLAFDDPLRRSIHEFFQHRRIAPQSCRGTSALENFIHELGEHGRLVLREERATLNSEITAAIASRGR